MLAWFLQVVKRVDGVDRRLTKRIGEFRRSPVDGGLRRLTVAANHSGLWLAIAALLAARRGKARRAALRGVLAIAATSFTANAVCKPLAPRRRPAADALPTWRTIANPPTSSSFPSGHAASAAAFTTAVAIESPAAAAAIAPLAATVAYSRVHVGVHWPSDVVAGAAIGTAVAFATRRWWPTRPPLPARARTDAQAPALPGGESLVVVTNPRSGVPPVDPSELVQDLLPAARKVTLDGRADHGAARLEDQLDGGTMAVGVAGGDGSVAAAAQAALGRGLPLAVLPTGTLNHFARDVGVETPAEAVEAVVAGKAVAVDLATVTVDGSRRRALINTASLGGYPDLVRIRQRWRRRIGKWPASALAMVRVLAQAQPLTIEVDGRPVEAWLLFVGNGTYLPRGMAPAWRPALDTGLLDIRYVRADLALSRTRFVLAAISGALHRSRTYVQRESRSLTVKVHGAPVALATDGEVCLEGNTFEFAVNPDRLVVYRP